MRMLPDILIMRIPGENSTLHVVQEPAQEHKVGPRYKATKNGYTDAIKARHLVAQSTLQEDSRQAS